ncbi:MAG: hypothetical protein WCF36_11640, partial [Candidatus Nanopelagicales bacterium]
MSISEPPTTLGRLSVTAPGARIRVLDAFLRPVQGATAMDTLTAELDPGAYRITARIGAREVSRAVLVRADGPPSDVWLAPDFDAAAPVYTTATANESHGELASKLTSGTSTAAGRLVVILRGLRNRPMADLPAAATAPAPTVRDQHGEALTLPVPAEDPNHVWDPGQENRALGWAVDVGPGGYRVRWAMPDADTQVEHALWIAPHSQTILFVPQGPAGPVAAGASVHIVPTAVPWDAYASPTLAVEASLAVLRSGSIHQRVEVWKRVLADPSAPPMLGLLTLHEMVRSIGADLPSDLRRDAQRRLRQLRRTLGESPDVVALIATVAPSTVCAQVSWPPMLRASHTLLLAGERSGRDLIAPGSLLEQVTGQMYASAPWHIYDPSGLDGPASLPQPTPPAESPSAAPQYSGRPGGRSSAGPFDSGDWSRVEGQAHLGEGHEADATQDELGGAVSVDHVGPPRSVHSA